jgi:hypothetical protein
MTLPQLHLVLVSFWLGLFAAESVLELSDRDPGSRRTIAVVHRWIDTLFEIPVAIAVFVTGSLLLARAWPVPPILLAHAGAGLIPVVVNVICIKWVHARWKETDEARACNLTRRVKLTGLGIPFAILALIIGLGFLPAG